MSGGLYVVESGVDAATVEALLALLKDAQAGRITGLAYVALYKGTGYDGDVVGLGATRHPLLMRGIADALKDEIAKLPHR